MLWTDVAKLDCQDRIANLVIQFSVQYVNVRHLDHHPPIDVSFE